MKKAFINNKLCVACGCCLTACKLRALSIPQGIHAIVNEEKCVGCGMCALKCPASIIEIREVKKNEHEEVV